MKAAADLQQSWWIGNSSIVVVVVFVLIFLLWHLHRCCRFLGPAAYPLPPPSLYPIPWMRRVSLVLCQRLCCRCLFLWPVLLCQRRRCCRQYHLPVNTTAPPPAETFTQTHCIFCFLNWRLRCRSLDLGLIFLYWRIHHGRLLLRPVIAMQQPPLLSPNIRFLGHIFYSLFSANASVIVVDSVGQAVK